MLVVHRCRAELCRHVYIMPWSARVVNRKEYVEEIITCYLLLCFSWSWIKVETSMHVCATFTFLIFIFLHFSDELCCGSKFLKDFFVCFKMPEITIDWTNT